MSSANKKSKLPLIILALVLGGAIVGYSALKTIEKQVVGSIKEMIDTNPLYKISYSEIKYNALAKELEVTGLMYTDSIDSGINTNVESVKATDINLDAFDATKGHVIIAKKIEATNIFIDDKENILDMQIESYLLEEPKDNIAQIIAAQELGLDTDEFWASLLDITYKNSIISNITKKDDHINLHIGSIESKKPEATSFDITMKNFVVMGAHKQEEFKFSLGELLFDDIMMPDAKLLNLAYQYSIDPDNFNEKAFEEHFINLLKNNTPFHSIRFSGIEALQGEKNIFSLDEIETKLDTTKYALSLYVNGFEITEEKLIHWGAEANLAHLQQLAPFAFGESTMQKADLSLGFDFLPMADLKTIDLKSYANFEHLFEANSSSQVILSKNLKELDYNRLSRELTGLIINGFDFNFKDTGIVPISILVISEAANASPTQIKEQLLAQLLQMKQGSNFSAFEPILSAFEEGLNYPGGDFKFTLPKDKTSIEELVLKAIFLPKDLHYTVSYTKGKKTLEEAIIDIQTK